MKNDASLKKVCWGVFAVVAFSLVVGGYILARHEEEEVRESKYTDLRTIAELKVGRIVEWRQERLADVAMNGAGVVRKDLLRWLENPGDDGLKAVILDHLRVLRHYEGYEDVLVAAPDGRILLSLSAHEGWMHETGKDLIARALASMEPAFGDFYRCPLSGEVHLEVAMAVLDDRRQPVAVLVLEIDPGKDLYPLIQSWPTSSRTAETLLVRRDGDCVQFVNELRHASAPPLSLRIPLSKSETPAVQAVLGKTGFFEGRDYRGVEVVADLRPVPGSPWFMVAKEDAVEILSDAVMHGVVVGLFTLAALLLTAVGIGFIYKHLGKRAMEGLYLAERRRREAQEEIRATLYGIGDGVITTDASGCVTRMNPVAEELTGWSEGEAAGKPLEEVFRIVNEETRAAVENPVERVLREGRVVGLANHTLLIARGGLERPIADSGAPIRDDEGRITGVVLVFRDQSEERRRLAALMESENRFRWISSTISDIAYSCVAFGDGTYAIDWMMGAVEGITGYGVEEIRERGCWKFLVVDEDLPIFEKDVVGLEPGSTRSCRLHIRSRRGEIRCVESIAKCVPHPRTPKASILYGALNDITERNQAEEALKLSEMAHRTLTWNVPEIVYRLCLVEKGRTDFFNDMLKEFTGYEPRQLKHGEVSPVYPLILPEDRERVVSSVMRSVAENVPFEVEYRVRHKDGTVRFFCERGRPVTGDDGEPLYIDGVISDVTDRKLAEREKALLTDTISASLNELYLFDAQTLRFRFVNHGALRNLGYTLEQIQQLTPLDLKPEFTRESFQELIAPLLCGERSVQVFETVHRRADGSLYPVEVHLQLFEYDGERVFLAVISDVTERKSAEEKLRKLSLAVEQSPVSVVVTDLMGNIEYVNPKFTAVTGYSLEEVQGQNPRLLKSGETPPEEYRKLWETITSGGDWHGEFHNRRKDGTLFWERASISPIRDPSGAITHFIAVKEDITSQKVLEEQFFQAQKMESVGRLAGGLAHDFNNMLGVIMGHAEVALMKIDPTDPIRRDLQEILQAGQRSANLISQLLAFARKQTVSPRVLDLNETVASVLKMLRRLIGEDIELVWKPGADLWPVKVDPVQIDQVLANLAVNARDAISGVGSITIETHNVAVDEDYVRMHADALPGRYVRLTVSDTGVGMDGKTLESIFEPFFTTKEVGKGTGLGLSTVYGVVRQNNGFINVYSEPGRGTTFRIYLPEVEGVTGTERAAVEDPIARGTETVLLVEDEETILNLGQTVLEQFGYRVLAATNPREALTLAMEHPGPIHLLVTDVVMPEMDGRTVRERVEILRPGIKTLFISGYPADVIAVHGVLEEGVHLLEKPFSMRSLAKKVREVLEQ